MPPPPGAPPLRAHPVHHEETPGEGIPFVLLHGILESAQAWARVARHLREAGRRVVLVDSRGHGRAEAWRPEMDWSPQADARDVAALLAEVAPEGAHLVGHSRGATSACWIATEEPQLARSLAVVASPPQASEVFRAAFRRALARAEDPREREALAYLAQIPEDDFPTFALRRYRGPALVVEAEDDPLYSPSGTLFWRMFLPYGEFERVPGGHRVFAEDEDAARWLAGRLLRHAPPG